MIRRVLQIALALACLGILAVPAQAKIYKYKDAGGQLHFVDTPAKVPRQYQDQLAPEDRIRPDGSLPPQEETAPDDSEAPVATERNARSGDGEEDEGGDPGEDARKKLKDLQRQNCRDKLTQVKERYKSVSARFQKWAAEEKDKGKIGDSPGYYLCESGNIPECRKTQRERAAKQAQDLVESSPYKNELQSLDSQIKRLQRECGS